MKIEKLLAREIFDSSGWPALECELHLANGDYVITSVPAGKSVGSHEAIELRDGGSRFDGKGLLKAIQNIEQIIAPLLVGNELSALEMDVRMIELDGTPNKARLGANTMLAVSQALFKAEALVEGVELFEFIAALFNADTVTIPYPLLEVVDGGVHAENNVPIQEILLMPVGAQTFRTALEVTVLVFHEFGRLLKKLGRSTEVGTESGYACNFTSEREALDLLVEAIEHVTKNHSVSCVIALDIASSELYDSATGLYRWRDQRLSSDEMIAMYQELIAQYPIYSIEDGLAQDDWQGWVKLAATLKHKAQIVGDDFLVTNSERIQMAADQHAVTSAIIKPNQVGTITQTLQAITTCKAKGLSAIISHRSSETEDTFIADLAVGTSAGQIKAGSGKRSAKYNRLLAIEDTLTLNVFDS